MTRPVAVHRNRPVSGAVSGRCDDRHGSDDSSLRVRSFEYLRWGLLLAALLFALLSLNAEADLPPISADAHPQCLIADGEADAQLISVSRWLCRLARLV